MIGSIQTTNTPTTSLQCTHSDTPECDLTLGQPTAQL